MIEKTNKKITRIAFFGDAEAKPEDQHYKDTFEAAKILGKEGYIIVNGGGPGVMLASTLGAKEVGAKSEVVIIDENVDMGANYEGSGEENKGNVDKIYRTNNIQDRTAKLVEIADAFLIFKGGTGTLAELALVWEKAKFEFGNHEPVIFVGDFWKEILDPMVKDLGFDDIEKRVYEIVSSPEDILPVLKRITSI